jgi:hypothetical protein
MTDTSEMTLIAVDIGNSRMKLGRFTRGRNQSALGTTELPAPESTIDLAIDHATGGFNVDRTGRLVR